MKYLVKVLLPSFAVPFPEITAQAELAYAIPYLFMMFFVRFPHITSILLAILLVLGSLGIGVFLWSILSTFLAQLSIWFFQKRRYLFLLLPGINLLFLLVLLWTGNAGVSLVEIESENVPPFPSWASPAFVVIYISTQIVSAVLGGIIGSAIVIPLHSGLRRLFRLEDPEPTDGTRREWVEKQAPSSLMGKFFEGIEAPWKGFCYMCRHLELFRYTFIPFLLNLFIAIGLLILLIPVAGWLFQAVQGGWGQGWFWGVLMILLGIVLVIAVLGVVMISWVFLQGILCDHFYAQLAEQVERQLGLPESQIEYVSFGFQVKDALWDTGWLLLVNTGCLLLNVVPGLGTVLGTVASYYFNAMTMGGDQFGHPLSIRGYRRSEHREFARNHWPQTLGLGTIVFIMMFIPVLGSLLLSCAVTGAVLLHRRLQPES